MLLVVALFVLAVSTQTLTEDPLYRDYLQWSAKYGKVYATGVVDNTRFSNWKKSLEVRRTFQRKARTHSFLRLSERTTKKSLELA